MQESELHRAATIVEIGLALVTFGALWFFVAPYGRHARTGFGPAVPQRLAWVIMEAPAVFAFAGLYAMGARAGEVAPLCMLALWMLHYLQRTFVFPFRIRASGKTTPLLVVLSAVVFNLLNAYVNARWVSHFALYPRSWLSSPSFLLGASLFVVGFALNLSSDAILFRLRRDGETGYQLPRAGLFRFVSCPNYLGEMVEWAGWALLTWSLSGFAFALYTAANLVPRAIAHHRWYRARFPDYPAERRALIPFVL